MPKYSANGKMDRLRARGFITSTEVAEMLGVTTRTVRNYRNSGKIKSYSFSNHAIYKKEEIDKIVNETLS